MRLHKARLSFALLVFIGTPRAATLVDPRSRLDAENNPFFANSKWRATWPRIPAMIFGANVSGPENSTQLEIDGMYPLVVYGWQHEDNSSNWTHVGRHLSEQCAALKRSGAASLCVVYRSVACTQPWFDADAAVMANESRKNTWFLQNSITGGPVVNGPFHPDPFRPEHQTWYWDYRNPQLKAHIRDVVVEEVMSADAVDGVFFDMVDYAVCGAFEFAPCDPSRPQRTPCGLEFPNGTAGMRAYFDGVWGAMRGAAERLAEKGKLALFSSTNYMSRLPFAPEQPQRMEPGACIQPQDDANAILAGVPWARYYERWVDGTAQRRGARSLVFNRSMCVWQIHNALREGAAGIATVMHTDVGPMWLDDPDTTPALLHIDTALAAFLVTAPRTTPSFYGFSFGRDWYDASYRHVGVYNRALGEPLGPAQQLGCCDGALLPHVYIHDAAGHVDLFNTAAPTATACAALCCATDACAGFQWTRRQAGAVGNCTSGGPCCWVKPTVGRLEHWTYNATAGSVEADMVSGVKDGLTFRRAFEHATVEVQCARPTGTITYSNTKLRPDP
eukprot:m.1264725 g.1264725  ORF g.1264725 m.1264725 type:complete len:559 (-) comp24736_c0_seq10:2802-4478(-)